MNAAADQLKTSHRFTECLYWNLFLLIPLITACIAIARSSVFWMGVYIFLSIFVFFVLIYKFFCTHCPHYIEESRSLKCMFFWGLPKYFKPQPGPYTSLELMVIVGSVLVWVAFPLLWLHAHGGLLVIYVLALALLVSTVRRYECGRCTHFDCPGNRVPGDVRDRYSEEQSRSRKE